MAQLIEDSPLKRGLTFNSFAEEIKNHTWNRLANGQYIETPPTPEAEDQALYDLVFDYKPIDPDDNPLVAVIGIGYVGAHLVNSFSSQYNVLGFDISKDRIDEIEKEYGKDDLVRFTTTTQDLREATHFLIAVPTLLRPDKTIDSSHLRTALQTVEKYARPGATVVFESSVAVGMTRQLLGPLGATKHVFIGMSPERVDPGRIQPSARSIPKIISGLDDIVPGSLERISRLYSPVFETIVPVSTPEVAEMTKLYENCQRMICIAYTNEMADACISHGVDPYEVCSAAATKPFGYIPFTPGLGVGGHCIPVNPYYLLSNSEFPLLQAATEKMWRRPSVIAQRALDILHNDKQYIQTNKKPRFLIVGIGFKQGQSSLSNSPGLHLCHHLMMSEKVDLQFADALVKQEAIPQIPRLDNEKWNKGTLETFHTIIVAFKQAGMDFSLLNELQGVRVEMWCK